GRGAAGPTGSRGGGGPGRRTAAAGPAPQDETSPPAAPGDAEFQAGAGQRAQVPGELGDEPRLAAARLAGDQHGRRLARARPLARGAQRGQFGAAPREHGADGPHANEDDGRRPGSPPELLTLLVLR